MALVGIRRRIGCARTAGILCLSVRGGIVTGNGCGLLAARGDVRLSWGIRARRRAGAEGTDGHERDQVSLTQHGPHGPPPMARYIDIRATAVPGTRVGRSP